MTSQPQLLQIPLDPGDVVFTPDYVARDMVSFFKPSGRILEPCAGDGVFLKYLPDGTEWCEISKGRDFFAWTEPVDWIVTNPPYNARKFNEWLEHSYDIATDIVFLFPLYYIHRSASKYRIVCARGNIRHARYYGTGTELGFPMGNPIFGMHLQRGYTGPMYSSIYGEQP